MIFTCLSQLVLIQVNVRCYVLCKHCLLIRIYFEISIRIRYLLVTNYLGEEGWDKKRLPRLIRYI
jgi:hypothetical protein